MGPIWPNRCYRLVSLKEIDISANSDSKTESQVALRLGKIPLIPAPLKQILEQQHSLEVQEEEYLEKVSVYVWKFIIDIHLCLLDRQQPVIKPNTG